MPVHHEQLETHISALAGEKEGKGELVLSSALQLMSADAL